MAQEDLPNSTSRSAANGSGYSGSMIGHILYERFLVEDDLTDHSIGGGFQVFVVKDVKNYCRDAVLKISRPVHDDSGEDGPSLKEVNDALARLRHPNIEEVLETGRFGDDRPFVLTRPYSAAPLDRLIAPAKRLELEGVGLLIEQVADALGAAHAKGILHCDLRPSNILVPDGEVGAGSIKIINFGSGWPIDVRGESLANVRPGSDTLHYAAPELLVTLGHRSPASDIYSLAVLAYRLVTGRLPFTAVDRAGMLEMIHAASAVSPMQRRTDIPLEAGELIMAGLQFEPLARPQKADDFGLSLIRMLRPPKGIPVAMEIQEPQKIEVEPISEQIVEPVTELNIEEGTEELVFVKPTETRRPVSDRTVAWALIILLMAGALSIPIGQNLLREKKAAAAVETIAARPAGKTEHHRVRFWFEHQRSSGSGPVTIDRQGFATGGHLAFVVDTAGYAYVFSEFTGEDGRTYYHVDYPAADQINPPKGIEPGKPVKAAPPQSGRDGPKAVWIVWTARNIDDLESAARDATEEKISAEEDVRKLRHFLERNRNMRVEANTDPSTGQTLLDTPGEKIVYRIEFGENGS